MIYDNKDNDKNQNDVVPGLFITPLGATNDYKLNLLKRSSFLSRNALLDLYFKIILPSVLYGLVVRGGCPNAELLHSLEGLPELYTTCLKICLPRKFTDIRHGVL